MIELEIKTMFSTDVEYDIWKPEKYEDVYFPLEVDIGMVGDERRDIFQILITTPEGLRRFASGEILSERATLVLSEFSWEIVRTAIGKIVANCNAPTWNESVLKLQRYFSWEYEDYILVSDEDDSDDVSESNTTQ